MVTRYGVLGAAFGVADDSERKLSLGYAPRGTVTRPLAKKPGHRPRSEAIEQRSGWLRLNGQIAPEFGLI